MSSNNQHTTRSKSFCCALLATATLFFGVAESNAERKKPVTDRHSEPVLEQPNDYSSRARKTPESKKWLHRFYNWGSGTLTGSWFGARNFLGDHGIAFDILYVAIPMGNLSGGLDTGFFGGGPLGVTLTVDTDRLFNWKGGTVFVDWEFFNWYNGRYSPSGNYDPSGSYVGTDGNFIYSSESKINQIAQLYYRQSLFDERLSVQLGKTDANTIFSYLESSQAFQDSIAMCTPTLNPYLPTYPNASTAVVATFAPFETFSFSAALFDGTTAGYDRDTGTSGPATGSRGPSTFFDNNGHWFVIAQANASWKIDPTRAGSLGVGGWIQTGDTLNTITDFVTQNVPGAFFQWEQTIWAQDAKNADAGGGVRFFGQFGWSDPEKNPVHWSLMAGFSATGILAKRPADAMGLMFGYSSFTDNPKVFRSQLKTGRLTGPPGGSESSIEAFYLAQITSSIYVQPGLLWIRTPGAGDPAPLGDAMTVYLVLSIDI